MSDQVYIQDIVRSIDQGKVIQFVDSCALSKSDFSLFPGGDASAYARCFAIFNYHLLNADSELVLRRDALIDCLYLDLAEACFNAMSSNTIKEKPYLQLLTFTLSALHILDAIDPVKLKHYLPELPGKGLQEELSTLGVFEGKARTGNTAMFYAILFLFQEAYLDNENDGAMRIWIKSHLDAMNRFGFWGPDTDYTYLHFQNGYHQYEILEYLRLKCHYTDRAAHLVATLQDKDGHFAPSPGGGGCYDYDATFILTMDKVIARCYETTLRRTAEAIQRTQNEDGGFCESRMVRPWKVRKVLSHVASSNSISIARQRARISFALARRRYNTVPTHWSKNHRGWGQSNLWDTWFRQLAMARIDHALNDAPCRDWGFIDFPGIGYHPSLQETKIQSNELFSSRRPAINTHASTASRISDGGQQNTGGSYH